MKKNYTKKIIAMRANALLVSRDVQLVATSTTVEPQPGMNWRPTVDRDLRLVN